MAIANYDYHLLLRASQIKSTIHEIGILRLNKQEDEVEKLMWDLCIKKLSQHANNIWNEGMSSTKGVNRSQPLFDIKDAAS